MGSIGQSDSSLQAAILRDIARPRNRRWSGAQLF
jgi:hypothetical protein